MMWLKTLLLCAFYTAARALMKEVHSNSAIPYQVYSATAGTGYVSMFVVTPEGVVVIDPDNDAQAKEILASIRNVTNQPVKYCIYSHNHWDHSGGGQVFRDVGAVILAHAETTEFFKIPTYLGQGVLLPDQSWDGKKYDLVLGGVTIELHYVGISHGWGMTVVLVPDAKVLFAADLVTPNRVLFAYMPDYNLEGTERSLRYMADLDFDKAVWSHHAATDDPLRIGSKQDVQNYRQYLIDIKEGVQLFLRNNTAATDIPKLLRLPKYSSWEMYNEWFEMNVFKVMVEMLLGAEATRPEWPWKADPQATTNVKVECHFSAGVHSIASPIISLAVSILLAILFLH